MMGWMTMPEWYDVRSQVDPNYLENYTGIIEIIEIMNHNWYPNDLPMF